MLHCLKSTAKHGSKNRAEACICQFIFRSETDPILLLINHHHVLVTTGWQSSKKPKAPTFQIGLGYKSAWCSWMSICIDWQSWIFDLTSHFQEGGHDVPSCRKVLPSGECSNNSVYSSWSILHSYSQTLNANFLEIPSSSLSQTLML